MKYTMKGLIIISTPKTKTELLQTLRENGYDRISDDQLERLLSILKTVKDESPKGVTEAVRNDIDGFVNGAPQFDDITMLEMIIKDF